MSEPVYDTVVVGGGFAGVAAARELSRAGRSVIVVEARDRLGGRTWYKHDDTFGRSLEFGGTWVHWTQPCVFAEVLRYGLELSESLGAAAPETFTFRTGQEVRSLPFGDAYLLLDEAVNQFCHDVLEVIPLPYDPLSSERVEQVDRLTVQQRLDDLDVPAEMRDMLSGLWSVFCSARCADASLFTMLRWYALSCHHTDTLFDAVARYKIKTGTRSLIEAMADDAGAEIRLSEPVAAVEQEPDGVRVHCRSGETIPALTAVVTAPLNTLNAIDFRPALSELKQCVISEGQASRGCKAWVRVAGNLPKPLMALGPDDEILQYAHSEEMYPDGQLLVTFGRDASLVDVNSVADMNGAMRRLLGDDVEVVATTGTDWFADEFSRGTWPVLRPNQATKYLRELQRPDGRVFLAGSETANGWNGFIDGAIESGVRAARQVMASTSTVQLSGAAVAAM